MSKLTAGQLLNLVSNLEPTLFVKILRSNNEIITRFNSVVSANIEEWCFFNDSKFAKYLSSCKASGIVLSAEHYLLYQDVIPCPNIIICPYPYAFFALAAQIIEKNRYQTNIISNDNSVLDVHHATAIIHPSATIGQNVFIGAWVTIAENVVIGDGCVIHPHCCISKSVLIGKNTILYSHVSLYHSVEIGDNCIIHSGTVIGSDGFGFAAYQKRWLKIPQTGTVIIGHDVEIGANCTIDRGSLENTVIGRGCKLDNLIQIAHNVKIGEDCAFASGVGIAGSAVLGNRIQIGGKAGVLGHLSICDDTVISSFTLVTKTIKKAAFYTGIYPIQENSEWEKNAVTLKKLFSLREQIKYLNTKSTSSSKLS
jgi:UDP-3-O-[3-hydroxymyristoyl] glucosamine N-acyltransferase